MSTIGYKVVSAIETFDNGQELKYPVILKLELPDDAIKVVCDANNIYFMMKNICRTNKVKTLGYYITKVNLNEDMILQDELLADPLIYYNKKRFINLGTEEPLLISRYSYINDKNPLVYRLDDITEIPEYELDTNIYNYKAPGINYFNTYAEAIVFLKANK